MVNTYRSIYQSQTNPCCESNKQFGDWYGMCVCPCRLGRGCPQPKCHASQAILFFVDISEHCGFSLPTQARVVCLCQMNHQVVGKRYTPHETETNTPRKSSGNRSCKNISFGFNVFCFAFCNTFRIYQLWILLLFNGDITLRQLNPDLIALIYASILHFLGRMWIN